MAIFPAESDAVKRNAKYRGLTPFLTPVVLPTLYLIIERRAHKRAVRSEEISSKKKGSSLYISHLLKIEESPARDRSCFVFSLQLAGRSWRSLQSQSECDLRFL